ncbi:MULTISPECIES: LexA family transcriptional regulator [unclassified Bradyrhizobium]|uniref:LexA family transcriptional regulator n=1 Tax=unclassified Bradyrhizobium TaxID=2631580 RepID=UPI002916AEE4|nr:MULTISPECIES: LexA family transcriptional regulator [unclassified Bradyrhizobium]
MVTALEINAYSVFMAKPKTPTARTKPKREYPNRIRDLIKERGWSYDVLAEKVDSHPKTIGSLARGEAELTWSWMVRLGRAFGVKPTEIMERQVAAGLRSVPITGTVKAGAWANSHSYDTQDQTFVTVPNLAEYRNFDLYARMIDGESMNKIYAPGSIVVLSRLRQLPGEIILGKRYHVRRRRGDLEEDTIKTLVRARDGEYWLQPESDSPEFAAFPLNDHDSTTVELVGRVRFALTLE